jgi:sugar O-acyltransferase (sialic acid O-acetyltransferase NeuD family)
VTRTIVLGAGGHAGVLIAALRRSGTEPHGCLDADRAKWGQHVLGVPVLGNDELLDKLGAPEELELLNAVGITRDVALRRAVWDRYRDRYHFVTVQDLTAIVDDTVVLGMGTQMLAGCIIQAATSIGANTIINTGAQIDHDCRIGTHCHIAPGAILCGNVTVGDSTFIGAGAMVKQGVAIGSSAIVGMGAVVIRDVPDGSVVLGCPAESTDFT